MENWLDKLGEGLVVLAVYGINEVRKEIEKKKERKKLLAAQETKKVEEIESVKFSVEVTLAVERVLFDIQAKHRSHRCFVTQYHNGEKYFTGLTRLKETITNEIVYPGQKKMKPDVNAVQMTDSTVKMLDYMKTVNHPYYYVENVEYLKDKTVPYYNPELYDLMYVYKVKSFIYVRLKDRDTDGIVAMLSLHFPHVHGMESGSDIAELLQTKNRIEAIFDDIE
jgi:hypothetical protein